MDPQGLETRGDFRQVGPHRVVIRKALRTVDHHTVYYCLLHHRKDYRDLVLQQSMILKASLSFITQPGIHTKAILTNHRNRFPIELSSPPTSERRPRLWIPYVRS